LSFVPSIRNKDTLALLCHSIDVLHGAEHRWNGIPPDEFRVPGLGCHREGARHPPERDA
jgi:hypothetical protein